MLVTATAVLIVAAARPDSPGLEAARVYRRANAPAILEEFTRFLAIPNVADDAPNIRRNAAVDPMPYPGAGAASCTHPLFVNPKYTAGDAPISVAIGDLDGVNGPELAAANRFSDDVSVLLDPWGPCPSTSNVEGQ